MTESSERNAAIRRTTRETDIDIRLGVDGSGQASVRTGVGFMDHMLTLFAVHGLFDLEKRRANPKKIAGFVLISAGIAVMAWPKG